MKKVFPYCILIISICLLLTGCQCDHVWTEATCTTSRVCTRCGETNGDPIGHSWIDATCISPKTCSVCNVSEGSISSHNWLSATCTTPQTCAVCNITEGTPWGHKWDDATCVKPMICAVCSNSVGEPLGHDWQDATCLNPSTCIVCGTTSGEALGHTVTKWTIAFNSTCIIEGSEEGTCSACGELITQALPLAEHTPGDWNITVEPTENSAGTRTKNCTVCGQELTKEAYTLSAEEIEARYKKNCVKIPYDDLARSPEKYKEENVKFTGYVVQVCSEASSPLYYSTYRVATSGKYDDVVYIYVDNYGSGERILEDDRITFYGTYDGLYSYTTVMGAKKTIPSVKVKYVD